MAVQVTAPHWQADDGWHIDLRGLPPPEPMLQILALFLGDLGPWLGGLAGLAAIAGGWRLKFVIIARAAYNQGFALPLTPVRGAGQSAAGDKPGWS